MFTIIFSTLLLFSSNFLDYITMRRIVSNFSQQNTLTSISCLGAFIITFCLGYLISDNLYEEIRIIITDWRFVFSLFLEFLALTLLRMNYRDNKGNMTAVKMAIFSSIFVVPIISYFFTDMLNFSSTIVVNYATFSEMFIITLAIIIIYIVLFSGRVSTAIKNPTILILMSIFLPIAIFMAVKNMQLFNSYLFFSLISLSNMILYITWAFIKKESFKHIGSNKKDYLFVFSTSMIIFSLFPYVASMISAEFFTILKRIFSIKIAVFFDARDRNISFLKVLTKKEVICLSLLILIGVYFQMSVAS